MKTCRRGQIFVDRDVQSALMLRVTGYWMFCLLSISLMLLCWEAASGPPRRFSTLAADLYQRYAPALAATLLVLPLVMIDVTRLSHRFVGPIIRLRGALRRLAAGEEVQPIKFRDKDFWQDLADDFNQAAKRVPAATEPEPETVEV